MPIDLRTSAAASVVALGCLVIVTARVAAAPGPVPARAATLAERDEMAHDIASREQGWWVETVQNFPEDHWSQRDDFHGREFRKVIDLANARGIRVEDVLRAVDDDIHVRRVRTQSAPDDRNARAVPCKPRPFYD